MNPRDISSLRWPRELLAEVIDSAPVGMALVALDGSVMRVNRALCEIVGCGEEDLLGAGFKELTHPDDVEATLEQMRRILITEIRTCRLQNRCLRKDGRVVWVKLSASLVRDERGEPAHFICQLEDATEAREGRHGSVLTGATVTPRVHVADLAVGTQDRRCSGSSSTSPSAGAQSASFARATTRRRSSRRSARATASRSTAASRR